MLFVERLTNAEGLLRREAESFGTGLLNVGERKAFGLRLALQFRFGRNHLALTASLKLFDELPAEFEVNEAPFLVES